MEIRTELNELLGEFYAGQKIPSERVLAERFGVARHYDNYADLANDPEVDIVYIATLPHTHLDDARNAIRAGKHVLIEKPSTLTAKDTETLYAEAKAAGVLAMEAMWSRYLPQASIIRQMLAKGTFGEITLLQADFGQDNREIARLWLKDSSIVMDMGIYPAHGGIKRLIACVVQKGCGCGLQGKRK